MSLYSKSYIEFLSRRDNINVIFEQMKDEFRGSTFYGEAIDVNNPTEMAALLYILYKDYELFHERL